MQITTQGVKPVKQGEMVVMFEVNVDDHVLDKGRRCEAQSPSVASHIAVDFASNKEAGINRHPHVPRFHQLMEELGSDHFPVPVKDRCFEGRDLEPWSL